MIDINKQNKINKESGNFFIIFFLIIGLFAVCLEALKTTYDNDLWWLLATGREIIQNGFPKTNPWAIHDGMEIIIQQWIPSIILYGIYSLGNMPAVEIMLVIQIVVLTFILWKLCVYLTEGKNAEWILLTILIAFLSLSSYFSSRPQIYTMMFYALLILDIEKYRRTEQPKYLYFLPLITMLHVNFHASMAPLDIFIILLYLIPDIPCLLSQRLRVSVQFKDSSYARRPLLIAAVIACVSMLVNPYGIRGALYLLESYGAADYRGFIAEMGETRITSPAGYADIMMLILGGIVIGRNGKKIDFPLTVLFVSTAFVSMMHERNIWLVALFAVPLVASGLLDEDMLTIRLRFLHYKVIYAIFFFAALDFMLIYGYANIWPTMVDYINLYKDDSLDYPLQACDWLDEYASENHLEKNQLRIFNNFNNGGVLEFRGYKVTIDQRPELWEPAITGLQEHYYQENVDFVCGDMPIADYMGKYDWDFYLVLENGQLEDYMEEHVDRYEVVKKCNGYSIWGNAGK